MSKSYACAICTKRVGPKERRKLKTDGNKQLIKYLRKHMLLTDEVTEKDVVHNSCRLKYTAESAAARLSASPKKNPQHEPSDKKSPFQLNIKSAGFSHTICPICNRKGARSEGFVTIPGEAIMQLFINKNILLKKKSRCCNTHMSGGKFTPETLSADIQGKIRSTTYMEPEQISSLINSLRQSATQRQKSCIDFDDPSTMTDADYWNLTGLTKDQFSTLIGDVDDIRTTKTRSIRTCIALLLVKLRTSLGNALLSTLFNMTIAQIRRALKSSRKSLLKSFVPKNMGFKHVSREEIKTTHTRPLAQELFAASDQNKSIIVLDGTYIYIQKSSNFSFARRSYSMHKHRPLVKPMIVVSTTGYIISILGPYLADSKNSDANILKHIINQNTEDFKSWIQEGDVVVVDRGFRDASTVLEELGVTMQMPSFMRKGSTQHTSEESNKSRLVTKVTMCELLEQSATASDRL
ncbi:uncharacterized protein LOC127874239 isoform X3 [Dreissena polymorpha]|uniref:uncharacterized protein LOC127874239 isoform X3 n=1 Tax=Dreissena polymorpha TaxID=45954 RepID=UPI0022640EFE|nr:uncharacterized protein LOC127874239 isoform X3 [Dreissena polymorpha]